MIPRLILPRLKQNLIEQKVVLIQGPRNCGKKTIVRTALTELGLTHQEFDLTDRKIKNLFTDPNPVKLKQLFDLEKYILISEAQYLENLQHIIEMVLSGELNCTLILCCSYEPVLDDVFVEVLEMQGLKINFYPPSFYELAQFYTLPEEEKLMESRLIFGNYPLVVTDLNNAESILNELVQTVIFTDLGVSDRINKGENLFRMLQVIAFNIGEPLSFNEIGEKSGLDNETVERYVRLLEKCGILFCIGCFYNGYRYELKKSHMIYFVDNGIRNAVIRNFNPPAFRNDIEMLWRNWLIAEKIKWNKLNGKISEYQFWRTHTRQTIDFIEKSDSNVQGYKTSWEKKKKIKFPQQFIESYPEINLHTLNRSTYLGFLSKK